MAAQNIYRVSWYVPDGARQEWHSTRIKAERAKARIVREERKARGLTRTERDPLVAVEEVIVDTSKVGLCDWLNRHFAADNG